MTRRLYCLALAAGAILLAGAAEARTVELRSPDGRNVIAVSLDASGLGYRVTRDGRPILARSELGLVLQVGKPAGTAVGAEGMTIANVAEAEGTEAFERPVG